MKMTKQEVKQEHKIMMVIQKLNLGSVNYNANMLSVKLIKRFPAPTLLLLTQPISRLH